MWPVCRYGSVVLGCRIATSICKGECMKKQKAALRFKSFFAILCLFAGIAGLFIWAWSRFGYFEPISGLDYVYAESVRKIIFTVSSIFTFIGLLSVIVCAVKISKIDKALKAEAKKKADDKTTEAQATQVGDVEQLTATNNGPIVYVPAMEAYKFVNMGDKQTIDEKFDQIAKMDKTQFVVYVARLFSRKGYSVKLTPVMDNYCVDMVVEKNGTAIAVGVVLATRLLGRDDIAVVDQGRKHYPVNNAMVLTNIYFDTTAVEYAREHCMSLVDRNVLANEFMA